MAPDGSVWPGNGVDRADTRDQAGRAQRIHRIDRANALDGRTWQRYSISVWSDIKKTLEEHRLRHPALFPLELVLRLIQCFSNDQDVTVLDPFAGVGSTPIAAQLAGKRGIGIELSPAYSAKARERCIEVEVEHDELGAPVCRRFGSMALPLDPLDPGTCDLYTDDARNLLRYVSPSSVDLVITSPPYWDILLRERSANRNRIKHYGREEPDLGKISAYDDFLDALRQVFVPTFEALRPGKYCIVVVMDLRKRNRFYPLHMDVAALMQSVGFQYDDLLIWDRRHEYNHMRPLGYPYRFRVNKAHEFLLIFRKPAAPGSTRAATRSQANATAQSADPQASDFGLRTWFSSDSPAARWLQ